MQNWTCRVMSAVSTFVCGCTAFNRMPSGMFGAEPFLVKIGNGCHITSGVEFITHAGVRIFCAMSILTLIIQHR